MQTHSRLAAHITRGNVTLPNIPPVLAPVPAPVRPPTPGGGGGGQPPTGGRGGGEGGGQPPTGGGGGGRGGGQPPAGGGGGEQANPPTTPSLRLCRNPPEIFTRDREKADHFLSQLKHYYLANIGVPEFNSWI